MKSPDLGILNQQSIVSLGSYMPGSRKSRSPTVGRRPRNAEYPRCICYRVSMKIYPLTCTVIVNGSPTSGLSLFYSTAPPRFRIVIYKSPTSRPISLLLASLTFDEIPSIDDPTILPTTDLFPTTVSRYPLRSIYGTSLYNTAFRLTNY